MALTEKEVLSDAGEMVERFISSLQAQDMTIEQQAASLKDAQDVFNKAAEIIKVMIEDKLSSKGKPIH